jgi:pimeloyl-ACP methyl ester carboxylesterase
MKRAFRIALRLVLLLLAALLFTLFFPVLHKPFVYQSGPIPSYDEAVREIRDSIAATPATIRPEGRPILMEHGHPTEYVFVFLHGLSNCPIQFSPLGKLLFERGHNVYIPRMPYHGEENRMTTDWARLTARDMLDYGNTAADVARGLGKKVIVAGLSVNGTTTAWMAQNRSDLHKVALLSPFLAPAGMPSWTLGPLERLLLRLPNIFLWWNPVLKEDNPGPPYAYPRFPTRVIGETMLLGNDVLRQAARSAPISPSILVVTTANDPAANNAVTQELVDRWRSRHPVTVYQFPADLKVPHDFIDPHQPDQQVDLTYPKLIELLEN